MDIWLQHLLVLLIVLASATIVAWQIVQSLRGKKSRVGSCCAKGCASQAPAEAKPRAQRIVFMPVEMLSRRK
jgi:hypothetical protein